jgi:predicted nucleic acid-binding protein
VGLAVVARHPTGPLVVPAFDLADRSNRTVYDCLYLALAVQLGGVMVTADDKLANALAGTPWAAHITRLQDVP